MSSFVAVTGAEGFIGSHLTEELVARGHRVRAMVQYNSFGSRGWLDRLGHDTLEGVEIEAGDVRDPGSVASLLDGVDVVCHLAALIAIPYSYVAPRSYVDTNVTGTLNVLEAVRRLGIGRLVHTSTSEVYGTARTVPIDETHPLQAQSPYAASKVAADKLVESYHLSFGLPAVTLRPFNTYGPRQSARAIIPTVISQIAAGERAIHLGSLSPTRDFNFATDTAAAFCALVEADDEIHGRTFNAGSGTEISIGELVVEIGQTMGVDVDVSCDAERVRPEASEVQRLVADSIELRMATSWKPQVDLTAGLARTARWFTDPENLAQYRTAEYAI
ncbi:MAG TPA: SDR family NAD(P)-dependent oxidoreductase [Acidimicrobiales bacterium]|nr:SDR family NAD(P)-dependent oxidoreductase [Acidimicrobiales bacterium]